MKQRNKKEISIRLKMVMYLSVFTIISLVMLLMFQVLFMDDFYEMQKIAAVKNAGADIAQAVEEGDGNEHILYWHTKEQCSIMIVNEAGEVCHSTVMTDEFDTLFTVDKMKGYYDKAVVEGEFLIERSITVPMGLQNSRPEPASSAPNSEMSRDSANPPQKPDKRPIDLNKTQNGVLYGCLAGDKVVLVVAIITPVDATISTLYLQFAMAAVVLVVFAGVMAWIFSGKIARPIHRINEAAKRLPEGTYCSPDVKGYKEVVELRETLDHVSVDLQKNEQLQQELIANVSHDLRTPLTMITGYSEAIRDLPGEDSYENIQVVIDEANRLTHLVNDVLDLSKLQSGTQPVTMEKVDLATLLRTTVDRCQTMVASEGYCIDLQGCDSAMVCGDVMRITQIIYNLLGNALSHTGDDHTVTVAMSRQNGRVRVAVSDSGDGIPEEELANIWRRYYQHRSQNRKRRSLGTGLGLSIVYNLVSLHGGCCGVESTLGQGSTFWFDLPLAEE